MPGTRKTALVIISDGLDRGSKTTFDKVLNELQQQNIVVYSLQIPDRTGGAYRRDQPKANAVVTQLAEQTGGLVLPFDDAAERSENHLRRAPQEPLPALIQSSRRLSYDARRLLLVADRASRPHKGRPAAERKMS